MVQRALCGPSVPAVILDSLCLPAGFRSPRAAAEHVFVLKPSCVQPQSANGVGSRGGDGASTGEGGAEK